MKELSIQHQGRELLHSIGLLTHCLRLAHCGAAMRDDWERSLLCCREGLERLHAGGLPRNFLLPSTRPLPPGARTPQAAAPDGADDPATGLEPWQRELILRLERGLFRRLNPADAECIAWNRVAGTMSVMALPLLTELRAHNLTSNVFRRAIAPPVSH